MKKRVLIIKLGLIETIGNESSNIISLGDILRTTPLLHLYKDWRVSWLTAREGFALLRDNPYINRILFYDSSAISRLKDKEFDAIINLEKDKKLCRFSDSLSAKNRYGFYYDKKADIPRIYDLSFDVLINSSNNEIRRTNRRKWIEMLYSLVGAKWQGEGYILGYKPEAKEVFDLGFNIHVGKKWTNKAWPVETWKELEKLIVGRYTYSYQHSPDNIENYIEWINQCRLLITNDSLGMHIALALKKKAVVIFGPTSDAEIEFYGQGKGIYPEVGWSCIPCFLPKCSREEQCIATISPKRVLEAVDEVFRWHKDGIAKAKLSP